MTKLFFSHGKKNNERKKLNSEERSFLKRKPADGKRAASVVLSKRHIWISAKMTHFNRWAQDIHNINFFYKHLHFVYEINIFRCSAKKPISLQRVGRAVPRHSQMADVGVECCKVSVVLNL
ncbi:hypothetical protein CEXT_750181 [Caerostris extrusa]|uniref:Uncharacterized protein n=1 Tax=Caerostris extrusa TaxID=172846 RepID=A0AAV4NTV2_CAEEX|nr:hypothetical protein CEXT_750181 [Caerostris extrusa]